MNDSTYTPTEICLRGLITYGDYQHFATLQDDDFAGDDRMLFSVIRMVWHEGMPMTRDNIINMVHNSIAVYESTITRLDAILMVPPPTPSEATFYTKQVHNVADNMRFKERIARANAMIELGDFDMARAEIENVDGAGDLIVMTMAEAEQAEREYDRKVQEGDIKPISFGISALDRVTGGGIQPQDLVLFMAPTGGGKSSLAYNFALKTARQNIRTVIVSLEVDALSIYQNTLSIVSQMPMHLIRGKKNEDQLKTQEQARKRLRSEGFTKIKAIAIHPDQPDITIEKVKSYIKHNRPELLIIDYMQLVGSDGFHKSRFEALTHIMRTIQQISVAYCPVFLLVQYNREGIHADGTSAIEKSATIRIEGTSLEDPDTWEPKDDQLYERYHLRVTKNRNGMRGESACWFDAEHKTFKDMQPVDIDKALDYVHSKGGKRS